MQLTYAYKAMVVEWVPMYKTMHHTHTHTVSMNTESEPSGIPAYIF